MWIAGGLQMDSPPHRAHQLPQSTVAVNGVDSDDDNNDVDSDNEEYSSSDDGDNDYVHNDVDIEAVAVEVPYISHISTRNKPVVAEVEATIYREDAHYQYEHPPTALDAEAVPLSRMRWLDMKHICLLAKCLCYGAVVTQDERSIVSMQVDSIALCCSVLVVIFSAILLADKAPLWRVHIELKIPSNKYDYAVYLRRGYCSAVNGGSAACIRWDDTSYWENQVNPNVASGITTTYLHYSEMAAKYFDALCISIVLVSLSSVMLLIKAAAFRHLSRNAIGKVRSYLVFANLLSLLVVCLSVAMLLCTAKTINSDTNPMTDIISVCWLIFNQQSTYPSISINTDNCTSSSAEGVQYITTVIVLAAAVIFFSYMAIAER